jgi:hypothetical protein
VGRSAVKGRDPETPDEWLALMALSTVLLAIDSCRQYGLVTGGPAIDARRCDELLSRGAALGYQPSREQVDEAMVSILRSYAR